MLREEINIILKEGNYLKPRTTNQWLGLNKDGNYCSFGYGGNLRIMLEPIIEEIDWIIDNTYKVEFDKILNKNE